jgi:hypothetical protein
MIRPTPRVVATTNPATPRAVQLASIPTAHGIALAEAELRRTGYDREHAQHVARMVVLMFLAAFDGAELPAGRVLEAVIDRCRREGWTREPC